MDEIKRALLEELANLTPFDSGSDVSPMDSLEAWMFRNTRDRAIKAVERVFEKLKVSQSSQ